MSDMTDYEINKRLAEIAGVNVTSWADSVSGVTRLSVDGIQSAEVISWVDLISGQYWSPLTDWLQLGPLMVKEMLTVVQSTSGSDSARAYYPPANKGAEENDTRRAIALAIIYKHEED